MKYSFHISDTADEQVRQSILAPLRSYNQSKTGPYLQRGLAIELRDDSSSTVGGLWGWTSYDWLFVQLLVVPEDMRGKGVGRSLLESAEAEASSRGCGAVWLDTFEFQAKGFYERLGYQCFGELKNYPDSFSRYFMQKRLGSNLPDQTSKVS